MIHLITGNTGAGKSTYAKKLAEIDSAILFSIDEWNSSLFLMDKKESDGLEWMLERINRSEKIIWNLCMQLDMQSQDVVLDLGFSKFEHREKFRKLAKQQKIDYKLHFLDFTKEIRSERIKTRNQEKGETFVFEVDKNMFDFMENWYENPSDSELKGAIIIDTNTTSIDLPVNYFEAFAQHHQLELDFCNRLGSGLDLNIDLNTLRNYVLDFWDTVLSVHLNMEEKVFLELDKSNTKVKQFFEEHEALFSMINAIENSDSVSTSYLNKLIDLVRSHIKFEEQSFYPYLLDSYDDISLRTIKTQIESIRAVNHTFRPKFWEK